MNPNTDFEKAKETFILGLSFLEKKDFQNAENYFRESLTYLPDRVSTLTNLSSALRHQNKLTEAQQSALQSVQLDPQNLEGWINLGMIYHQMLEYDKSLVAYETAFKLAPTNYEVCTQLAHTLMALNRFEDALIFYKRATEISPDNQDGLYHQANALYESKNYVDALDLYKVALVHQANNAEAFLNMGNTLNALGKLTEALISYDEAIRLRPNYSQAYSNKGVALHQLKRYQEALTHHERSLEFDHNNDQTLSNKGITLHELKRIDEAIQYFNQAIEINPKNAKAFLNKANSLLEQRKYTESKINLKKSISLMPEYADAYFNLANVLKEERNNQEALVNYDEAIRLNPNFAEAYFNKAHVLQLMNNYEGAYINFEKAYQLNEEIDWIEGSLFYLKLMRNDWNNFNQDFSRIVEKTKGKIKTLLPFHGIVMLDDSALHQQLAKEYVEEKFPQKNELVDLKPYVEKKKIKIGYFSADFREHAVSYLTAELFELHNREDFEIIGFSYGGFQNDSMRDRLRKGFDQFLDVDELLDIEIAKLSRDLQIDIAVDLSGFTKDARTGIFSYRAAPIQISYAGYLGTTGASYIDYLIADRVIIPTSFQKHYSEKVIYLPSFQVNDRKKPVSSKVYSRQDLGLPSEGFIFCCFNSNFKILPQTFASWMSILKATDNSILYLHVDNLMAQQNLQKEAENRGVSSNRLVFAYPLPRPDYLARYRVVDLFLDTYPYNAGTTASDALWVGVPVLTMAGESFASRVASSILSAVELPELITYSAIEYEQKAIELAKDISKLEKIKEKLRNNKDNTLLFDTPNFTRSIESAYLEIHSRSQKGLPLDHVHCDG